MGYGTQSTDPFDQLFTMLNDFGLRLAELERPTGSQTYQAVKKLTDLVNGLIAQVNGIFTGYVSAGTTITAGGDITSAGGSFWSTYGRATPVVSSYVSAWFNGDGRLGATASSFRVKQDFRPADMSMLVEALRTVALLEFRRIEAVELLGDDAPVEKGGIAEYFITAGLSEYVFLDVDGEPQGINYELLTIPLIAAFQHTDARMRSLEARLEAAGL